MRSRNPASPGSSRWYNSLSVRVGIFLSIALLPLGLLAVLQTRDLTREVRNRSELSLLALTEHSASGERQMIERTLGAAEALSAALRLIRDDPDGCNEFLSSYVDTTQRYSYVGLVSPEGTAQCASNQQFVDFSDEPNFASLLREPRQIVAPLDVPDEGESSSVLVFSPVLDRTELIGFSVISVPVRDLKSEADAPDHRAPLSLVTFNSNGDILTTESAGTDPLAEIPAGQDLSLLVGRGAGTFIGENAAGEPRVFVYAEIVSGIAYALGTWNVARNAVTGSGVQLPTSFFPLLMWLASLAVAIFAIHRLVVRHLQKLSSEMRRFAIDRKLPALLFGESRPFEMQELEYSFHSMAHALLNDEARMEDALRDKNILLKEVHHRVKNNLQMISSIMNMKIRKAQSAETKGTIRRLQDRVLGLATVHRNLYQTQDIGRLNAGALLREIMGQILSSNAKSAKGVKISMELEDLVMLPDQVVPLSLLAGEIATNAINNLGSAPGAEPWIAVSFGQVEPGTVRLEVRNSIGADHAGIPETDGPGLGGQLIRAFCVQLDASREEVKDDSEFRVTITFPLQVTEHETQDY